MKKLWFTVILSFVVIVLSGEVKSLRLPLDGSWSPSQGFGVWNNCWDGYHLAEDVTRDYEASVYAISGGHVKFARYASGYGYIVIIEHTLQDGSNYCSLYGHLRQAGLIAEDVDVPEGQIIGYLTSIPADNSGTIHLHSGIRMGPYASSNIYIRYPNLDNCTVIDYSWQWNWQYPGYTRNANTSERQNEPYDITHIQMRDQWRPTQDFVNSHQLSCAYLRQDPNTPTSMVSGESRTIWVEFRNTGNLPWTNDTPSPNYIELKSESGAGTHQNLNSPFALSSWINPYTPTAVDEPTDLNGTARFTFNIKAPSVSQVTSYLAYFQPYNPNTSTWIEDDGDMHFVINVSPVFGQWKTSGNSVDCSGPVDLDGDIWYEPDFDDAGWANVTLPNLNWNCNDCDRYYRSTFNYSENQGSVRFYFRSDDGLWLYINSHLVYHGGGGCHTYGCVNGPSCAIDTIVPAMDITQYLQNGPNVVAAHVSNRDGGQYFNLSLSNPPVNFGRKLTSNPPSGQLKPGDTAVICLEITNNQTTPCTIDSIKFSNTGFNIGGVWSDFYTAGYVGTLAAGETDSFCAPFVVPSYGHGCVQAGFKSISCGNQWVYTQLNLDTQQKPKGLAGSETCSVFIGDAQGLPVILKFIPFLPLGWSYTPFITQDTFATPDTLSITIMYPDTAKLGEKGSVKVVGYRNNVEIGSFTCEREITFVRGDVNADTKTSLSDVIYLVNYIFNKGNPGKPGCVGANECWPIIPKDRADLNCDGLITLSDVICLVNKIFGKPKPPSCCYQ